MAVKKLQLLTVSHIGPYLYSDSFFFHVLLKVVIPSLDEQSEHKSRARYLLLRDNGHLSNQTHIVNL